MPTDADIIKSSMTMMSSVIGSDLTQRTELPQSIKLVGRRLKAAQAAKVKANEAVVPLQAEIDRLSALLNDSKDAKELERLREEVATLRASVDQTTRDLHGANKDIDLYKLKIDAGLGRVKVLQDNVTKLRKESYDFKLPAIAFHRKDHPQPVDNCAFCKLIAKQSPV